MLAGVFLFALLEGVVRIGVALFRPEVTLEGIFLREASVAAPASLARTGPSHEVVHPYVGYVVNPDVAPGFNRYGFLQVDGPLLKRRPGLIIVGVTGGSVARDVCHISAGTLKRRLTELVGPREIAVVCLAQEGFHQPQQAMTWAFFQSLGAEFDYLVNLDGFNEVALHPSETGDDSAWYAYPRAWESRLSDTANPELNRLIGLGVVLKQKRILWASRFARLQRLPLLSVHLGWTLVDDAYRDQILQIGTKIYQAQSDSSQLYSHSGPTVQFQSREERADALVDLWARCSVNLSQMCRGAGTKYLHRLQPNLWIDQTKTMTAEEQKLRVVVATYGYAAQLGYPRLVDRGADLRSQGIDFQDLTAIYADVTETAYADDCCHMSQLGYDLLATQLAEAIAKVELQPSN